MGSECRRSRPRGCGSSPCCSAVMLTVPPAGRAGRSPHWPRCGARGRWTRAGWAGPWRQTRGQPLVDRQRADDGGRLRPYSRDQSLVVLRDDWRFAAAMPAGSIVGTVAGGLLGGVVPDLVLLLGLAGLLLSAVEVWRHR